MPKDNVQDKTDSVRSANQKLFARLLRQEYHAPMPTFLDESGSFGWGKNASTYFTLTALWFETPALARACERVIGGVRAALGLPATFEFKFAKNTPAQRTAFLNAVSACSFQYVTCTLEKWRRGKWIEGRMWRKRAFFYEKVVGPVVDSLKEYLLIAEASKAAPLNESVTFDENTDPFYCRALREQFHRPKAPSGRALVKKIRSGKSDGDSLIQMADMVCGSFVHSCQSSNVYIDILKARKTEHIYIP
jgi:hypothetical protein